MRCYSPQPQASYAFKAGDSTFTPVPLDNPVAWNLVWLSLPQVDQMLDPQINFPTWSDSFNSYGAGSLRALSKFSSPDGVTVASLMGQSPIEFVQALQDHFNLPGLSFWECLGGQTWIDTMLARAYQADGMADIYAAAANSANVIVADFVKKVRMTR
jgi:hypothetical protein